MWELIGMYNLVIQIKNNLFRAQQDFLANLALRARGETRAAGESKENQVQQDQ